MPASFLALLANERPLINIDITLALNLAVWLGLFFFLRAVLWRPMLDLIEAREQGTEGTRKEALRLEHEGRELKAKLTTDLAAARATAVAERDALRAEGARRDAEITAKVRDEVAAKVETLRADLAAQRERARTELMSAVPALAEEMVAKVMRREVRS